MDVNKLISGYRKYNVKWAQLPTELAISVHTDVIPLALRELVNRRILPKPFRTFMYKPNLIGIGRWKNFFDKRNPNIYFRKHCGFEMCGNFIEVNNEILFNAFIERNNIKNCIKRNLLWIDHNSAEWKISNKNESGIMYHHTNIHYITDERKAFMTLMKM